MQITPPKQMTLLISRGVGSRRGSGSFLAYKGTQMPFFPAEGFLLLLVGYPVLLAGNLFEGA